MSAKEYLNQIGIIEARLGSVGRNIDRIRKEIEQIENIGIGSSWGDGQPHGRKVGDPTGNKAAQLADSNNVKRQRLKERLAELEHDQIVLQAELWSKRMEIIEMLTKVLDPAEPMTKVYHNILSLRYVEGESWEQIAVDVGYTWRHTIRLHGDALKRMEEVLNG